MKLLQIAFIAVLGTACMATYVTSETLHVTCDAQQSQQDLAAQEI